MVTKCSQPGQAVLSLSHVLADFCLSTQLLASMWKQWRITTWNFKVSPFFILWYWQAPVVCTTHVLVQWYSTPPTVPHFLRVFKCAVHRNYRKTYIRTYCMYSQLDWLRVHLCNNVMRTNSAGSLYTYIWHPTQSHHTAFYVFFNSSGHVPCFLLMLTIEQGWSTYLCRYVYMYVYCLRVNTPSLKCTPDGRTLVFCVLNVGYEARCDLCFCLLRPTLLLSSVCIICWQRQCGTSEVSWIWQCV